MNSRPMKSPKKPTPGKTVPIMALFILSAAIALSGAFFTVYSLVLGIDLRVLNANVPGAVFGLVVLYLGVRYFLLVKRLRKDVYRARGFNWNNLKPRNFFAKNK